MARIGLASARAALRYQHVIDGQTDATSKERVGGVSVGAGLRLRF